MRTFWKIEGSKTWFLRPKSRNQEGQEYLSLALNQKEEKKLAAWPILSPCTTAQMLIAFDEPCLTNMIPPFDFSCWTIALRLPYGMSTVSGY